MKRIVFLLAVFTAIIVLNSGCSSVTRRVTALTNPSTFNVNIASPLVEPAVEVKTKITGNAKKTYLFCFIPLDETVSMLGPSFGWWLFSPFERSARDAAAQDAFETSKADVLIAPHYTVKWKCYILWSTYTASVTGYAGKYTSFKQISIEEQEKLGLLDKNTMNINANIDMAPKSE